MEVQVSKFVVCFLFCAVVDFYTYEELVPPQLATKREGEGEGEGRGSGEVKTTGLEGTGVGGLEWVAEGVGRSTLGVGVQNAGGIGHRPPSLSTVSQPFELK